MDNVIRKLKKIAQKTTRSFDFFVKDDPLMIMPYRGYANHERLFIKGRILEDENIFEGKSKHELQSLIENFKRFESDEIPDAKVKVQFLGQSTEVQTDEEGYFVIDQQWKIPHESLHKRWQTARIELMEAPGKGTSPIIEQADVFTPSQDAEFGIISDIDDTVLQTHVTSRFRLKMIYAIFFQDASQRLPMEGIVNLYKQFVKGGDARKDNPIFYVSNSPYNLYDLIEEFMRLQQLPRGPILLRDVGLRTFLTSSANGNHKIESISHILQMYPHLPFIMLGDTGSKDADHYIEMAHSFPNRILAIYIRNTRDTRNARRVAQLLKAHKEIDSIMVTQTQEIIEHAQKRGFII